MPSSMNDILYCTVLLGEGNNTDRYLLREGGMVQNICREKTGQCRILFERRQDGIEYWLKEGGTVQNIG